MRDVPATGSEPVTVAPLREQDRDEYAAFLAGVPDALAYYSLPFRALLEDVLGCRADYWVARQDGRITGVLPLMWMDGALGRVGNSLPFYGSNGGALAGNPAAEHALVEKFNALGASPGVAATTWISHPLCDPPAAALVHDLEDERIGQFTSLEHGGDAAEALWGRIDGSARRNIRKAESSGVRVRVDNARLDFLERTHRENMAQIGGRAKPAAFFAALPRQLAANREFRIYVAEREGAPIAAMLLLYFNCTVEYYIPATVERERVHQPTALILWQAMREAAEAGFTRWNWGGTWRSQTGVWRFKRKWGGEDRTYRYFTRLNARGILSRPREELISAYPDFFVVPFDRLVSQGERVL